MKKVIISFFIAVLAFSLGSPTTAQAQNNEDLFLESIGAFTAQGMYLTYSAIGSLADSYENEVYDKDKTLRVLGEYLALAKVAREQLTKLLGEATLSANDSKFVTKCLQTYNYLVQEGEALKRYIETGNSTHVDTFHKNRKAAWANIQELLGLD